MDAQVENIAQYKQFLSTTKLQLLVSYVYNGGTVSRTNLNQRSYSSKLCSTENACDYLFQKFINEQRLTKIVYFTLFGVRLVSDNFPFYAYLRIILR